MGKNKGDKYRIKDNIVTMVYRHIHGSLINIYTESTTQTEKGYLSHIYTSQYKDPETGEPKSGKNYFIDKFAPLCSEGPWVLIERILETEDFLNTPAKKEKYAFSDLSQLD